MAAKTDWSEHIARLAELRAAGNKVSIQEYALTYGLNPNTARRYLGDGKSQIGKSSAARSSDHQRVTPKKGSNDQKRKGRKKSDQADAPSSADGLSQEINELSLQVKEAGQHARHHAASNEGDVLVGKLITAVSTKTKSGRARDQYRAGGQLLESSMVPSEEDMQKARDLIADAGVDKIEAVAIESSLVNLYCLNRTVRDVLQFLSELPPPGGNDKEEESGPNPITKALSVVAAAAAAINDTAKSLSFIRQSYARDKRDQELHRRKLDEPERIMAAYHQRKEQGWSAVDTAIYIETHGFKVPALLMEMARKEIKEGGNEKTTHVEYDPEKLDEEARQNRLARLEKLDVELAQKREAINQIVDEGGFGDEAVDGSLNDTNLISGFAEDEEPDDELNALLYGGDDGGEE